MAAGDGAAAGGPAMLRAAVLGVDEAARMVAEERFDDPLARTAVTLAAGARVVEDATSARARTTVARYLLRMGGRATPFGLFAGTAVAELGEARRLVLGERAEHRARVRVDVEALRRAVREALDEVGVDRWPLRANPTLRAEGGVLRCARSGDASADVVTVRATGVIEELLELLGRGTALGTELVERLGARRPGTPGAALERFVERLVDAGVLERAVDLVEPGVEPGELAVALLERIGDTERAAALRTLLDDTAGDLVPDAALPPRLTAAWEPAAKRVAAFDDVAEGHRFHVELRLATREAVLDRRTVADLEEAVRRLAPLATGAGPLDELRDAVRARYEDAEVPLLTALDPESGVQRSRGRDASELAAAAGVRWDDPGEEPPRVHPVRVALLDRWLRDGGDVDIADLPAADAPAVRSVQAALLDEAGGYRSMLVGAAGRAPFALLARFCLGSADLERRVRAWTDAEDTEDADGADTDRPIRAELVHDPGGRISNVLVRPRATGDVVALSGGAGGTLGLDRLLLRVQGDELALRDAVTGRPVRIELNSAHNVDMAGQDPLYSVLGHLASPRGVAWTWGPLDRLGHLPRVVCGSVVVAPERWRVRPGEVRAVLAAPDPAAALRALLPGVGDRRWVGTGAHDHVLPIDLRSGRSVAVALARADADDDTAVVELPQLEHPGLRGPGGGHVAEVVVPLRRAPRPAPRPRTAPFDPARGAAWAYLKYYTGHASADLVAARAHRAATALQEAGRVREWFFLRYQDDGHHVRVRARPARPADRGAVLAALHDLGEQLRAEGLTSRVVADDYVPEVGRYGGPRALALAEALFTADSCAVAELVAGSPPESVRLHQAVADVLHWTAALFGPVEERLEFLTACSAGMRLAFPATGNAHGALYREQRAALDEHLARAVPDRRVIERLTALATAVRTGSAGSGDDGRDRSVLGSALHLHCNRLFGYDANRLEFLAYELARRKLREQRARAG